MGGTFDPIHLGHLTAASLTRRCARLDRVILVPSGRPPHRGAASAAAADRLEMCLLVAKTEPWLEVSDVELRRSGPSYTIDTLNELARRRPDDALFLILGWDAAREIRTWREPERVLALAPVVVIGRPGWGLPDDADLRRAGLEPGRVIVCSEKTPDIHATEVRRRAALAESLEGLVPPAVERFIRDRGLYSTQTA
jgi:nicotinate-nucleotide adenylyltransferase